MVPESSRCPSGSDVCVKARDFPIQLDGYFCVCHRFQFALQCCPRQVSGDFPKRLKHIVGSSLGQRAYVFVPVIVPVSFINSVSSPSSESYLFFYVCPVTSAPLDVWLWCQLQRLRRLRQRVHGSVVATSRCP